MCEHPAPWSDGEPAVIRCPSCGNKLGEVIAGEVVVTARVRGGEKRTVIAVLAAGAVAIVCEKDGGRWEAAAAPGPQAPLPVLRRTA